MKKSCVFISVHLHPDHCVAQIIVVLYVVRRHYVHRLGVLMERLGSRRPYHLLLLIAAPANRAQTTQQQLNYQILAQYHQTNADIERQIKLSFYNAQIIECTQIHREMENIGEDKRVCS